MPGWVSNWSPDISLESTGVCVDFCATSLQIIANNCPHWWPCSHVSSCHVSVLNGAGKGNFSKFNTPLTWCASGECQCFWKRTFVVSKPSSQAVYGLDVQVCRRTLESGLFHFHKCILTRTKVGPAMNNSWRCFKYSKCGGYCCCCWSYFFTICMIILNFDWNSVGGSYRLGGPIEKRARGPINLISSIRVTSH